MSEGIDLSGMILYNSMMFEDIVSTYGFCNEMTDWELRVDNVYYKGWFSCTDNSLDETWPDDELRINYSIRILSEVSSYVKHIAFCSEEHFYMYNNWDRPDEFSIERCYTKLPTKKELTLYKLKNPPMFPDDKEFETDFADYITNIAVDSCDYDSICDWEAYYCLRD